MSRTSGSMADSDNQVSGFVLCTSPWSYSDPGPRSHTFEVRAVDQMETPNRRRIATHGRSTPPRPRRPSTQVARATRSQPVETQLDETALVEQLRGEVIRDRTVGRDYPPYRR